MVRLAVSPELSAWIADRIAAFPTESPHPIRWEAPYVAEFGALPLYLGWWETIGIRADGEILSWSTEGDYPGTRPVEDRYVWLSSLVEGARRHEALLALLPTRPADAVDCPHLTIPGFAESQVICPDCCGLGWFQAIVEDTTRDRQTSVGAKFMSWNDRLMVRDGRRYAVHAVYYADDGRIFGWSAEPMSLTGESTEELGEELERFRRALSEPVLDYETGAPLSAGREGS